MTKLTKEQVKRLRNDFECWQQDYDPIDDKEQHDMFGRGMVAMDMLISILNQEPVAPDGLRLALSNAGIAAPESDEMLFATHEKYIQLLVSWVKERKPFKPAAVPDAISTRQAISKMEECEPCDSINVAYKYGWNACRAAMLQGKAEPVSQPYTLPDGYVLVPVEPTEDMIIAGFEAELREEFRDPEAWEAFEAMSGCEQAALRAKWCWDAMIAAAPQQ